MKGESEGEKKERRRQEDGEGKRGDRERKGGYGHKYVMYGAKVLNSISNSTYP